MALGGAAARLSAALLGAALAAAGADVPRPRMGISDEEALRASGAASAGAGGGAAGAGAGAGRRELVVKEVANSTREAGARTNFSVNFSAWVAASSEEEPPQPGPGRPWPAAPPEGRHRAAGAGHRVAEVSGGEPCDATCELDSVSATCRERIDWARTHIFDEKSDACGKAHRLVARQCPECSGCGLGAACGEHVAPATFGSDPPNCRAEPPLPPDTAQWCCERHGLGCQDLFPPYDCGYGHFDSWSAGKRGWCCAHAGGRGCPGAPPAEAAPVDEGDGEVFGADYGPVADRTLTASKTNATPDTTAEAFDCFEGLASWPASWHSDKKAWCCLHHTLGCGEPRARPTPVTASVLDTGDWTTSPARAHATTTTTTPSVATTATATGARTRHAKARSTSGAGGGSGSSRGAARSPAARNSSANASRRSSTRGAVAGSTSEKATRSSPSKSTPGSSSTAEALGNATARNGSNGSSSATTGHLGVPRRDPRSSSTGKALGNATARDDTTATPRGNDHATARNGTNGTTTGKALGNATARNGSSSATTGHVGVPRRDPRTAVGRANESSAPAPAGTSSPAAASSGAEARAITTSEPFDCQSDLASWQFSWPVVKAEWCCTRHHVGCPPTVTTTTTSAPAAAAGAFDCAWSPAWHSTWSPQRREWCCRHLLHGCAFREEHAAAASAGSFDCTDQRDLWSSWSRRKAEWCCERDRGVGPWCPANGHEPAPVGAGRAAALAAAPPVYDCREEFFDWKRSWSRKKIDWCCRHGGDAVQLQLGRGGNCAAAPAEEAATGAITQAAAVPGSAAWLLGRSTRSARGGAPLAATAALAALALSGAVLGLRRPCGAGAGASHEGYEALGVVVAELYEHDPLDAPRVNRAAE